jgi:DNA-binding response OmpR family regulator
MRQATILVVDDEPRIVEIVRDTLEPAGYTVMSAADGEQGLRMAETHEPDLIVLDIGLPGVDGWEVCRRLRELTTIPILMLTARGDQQDKVRGLELGADDYLPKPFGVQELLARVRALLRRAGLPVEPRRDPVFVCGDLSVNFATHQVVAAGRPISLTPTEYKLLHELVTNAGRVVLHTDLLRKVWGRQYDDATEYVRVYIRYLRQKIEPDPARPRYILTEPGVGYRFTDPPTAPLADSPPAELRAPDASVG